MTYQEYAPCSALASHVKCFWSIERDFQPLNGFLDILPDSHIELIFNLGSDCMLQEAAEWQLLPSHYLVGLHEKPFRLHAVGVIKTIGVRFFAWGLPPALEAVFERDRHIAPLDAGWTSIFDAMTLLDSASAVRLLENHLLRVSEIVTPPASQDLAVILPHSHEGGFKVEALAREASFSKRQLERLFRRQAQITPKTLSQRMRFEQVRNKLCHNPEIDFAMLALDCGYADQAHLSRDFKHFANRTLSQFVEEIRTVSEELRYGVAFPSVR